MTPQHSATATLPDLPLVHDGPGHSLGWWGMSGLIVTEALLFAYLLISYFYFEAVAPGWLPADAPELRVTLPNTFVLLASSATMHWAERSHRAGSDGKARTGLALTFLLGAAFLVGQGWEYAHLGFGPGRDSYASTFFTVTGFHGAHVFLGLVMLALVQIWHWTDRVRGSTGADLFRNAAMYWHFVDIVWIAVFSSLYLSPRIL